MQKEVQIMSSTIGDTPPPAYSAIQAQVSQPNGQRVIQVQDNPGHRVFSIALIREDRLRLVDCPPGYYELVSGAIKDNWGPIKTTTLANSGAIEFVLQGVPWSALRLRDQSIRARRVIGGILQSLARHGWSLLLSSEISKKSDGRDTLFFEDSLTDSEARIFAICFSRTDRIRVISAPTGFVDVVRNAITAGWRSGIQSSKNVCSGTHEFQLNGFPWIIGAGVEKCALLSKLCSEIRNNGYKLHASVKLTKKLREMPTWYFRKVTRVYY